MHTARASRSRLRLLHASPVRVFDVRQETSLCQSICVAVHFLVTKRSARAWIAVPLLAALTAQPVLAVSVGGLGSVVRQLKASTVVPILLPARFPDSLTGTPVHAFVVNASHSTYSVELATNSRCNGSPACLVATVAGRLGLRPSSGGRKIRLTDGTTAYYDASGLTWKRRSAWYRLHIPGASLYSLRMAAVEMRSF
jgi:hypothetical protein